MKFIDPHSENDRWILSCIFTSYLEAEEAIILQSQEGRVTQLQMALPRAYRRLINGANKSTMFIHTVLIVNDFFGIT